jgi:Mn2+/Fe2+ NRAMP family transporter
MKKLPTIGAWAAGGAIATAVLLNFVPKWITITIAFIVTGLVVFNNYRQAEKFQNNITGKKEGE